MPRSSRTTKAEAELNKNIRRRTFVSRQIETLEHGHSTGIIPTQLLKEQLPPLILSLNQVQNTIIDLCEDHEFDREYEAFKEIMNNVRQLQTLCLEQEKPSPTQQQQPHAEVQLPKLNLPTFDGKCTEWIQFADLFSASIGNNERLSGAQKLQYLKGCLSGEAAQLIQHFVITNDNFAEAWTMLELEYKNERKIVFDLLRKLRELPVVSGSVSELRELRNTSTEVLRSLKVMKMPVQHWDAFIVFEITEKLDKRTREDWSLTLPRSAIPSVGQLFEFLEHKVYALREVSEKDSSQQNKWKVDRCGVCGTGHRSSACPQMLNIPVSERKKIVREKKLCTNCLRPGHFERNCIAKTCRICGNRHHTLLHEQEPIKATLHGLERKRSVGVPGVLLQTIRLEAIGPEGTIIPCTALLDTGAEVSLITEGLAKTLNLQQWRNPIQLSGTGANLGQANNQCCLNIRSLQQSTVTLEIQPFIRKRISSYQPPRHMERWNHLNGLKLADPDYGQCKKIDLLLSAEIYAMIVREGIRRGPEGSPVAQNSTFGWILTGATGTQVTQTTISHIIQSDPREGIHKYFELEEVPDSRTLTKEETRCEEHFVKHTNRTITGRYQVSLPFHAEQPDLGDSFQTAKRRFFSLETRFKKNPKLHKDYMQAMQDYLDQAHMELIPEAELRKDKVNYLPHHPVIREDKSSTKLRVVFDASAQTTNGKSLNDTLMNGPKTQDDLFDILIRFRTHKIALVGDIKQMYRNININPSEKDYQRIIWRRNPNEPLQEYRLTTVTFGLKSAPFLATRVLQQLADDEEKEFPKASKVTKSDFYVDDLMTGTETVEEAIILKRQLEEMFTRAGFTLTKWNSNISAVIQKSEEKEVGVTVKIQDETETTKTLGLTWCPKHDEFKFIVALNNSRTTKRGLLSEISRVFDPLGWLSPVTITGKILLQTLWKVQKSWDAPLAPTIIQAWNKHRENLRELARINIPRIVCSSTTPIILYGFADASESAYAAVVYVKEFGNTRSEARLLTAKNKVAPIKTTTLPRLELCSILLLARLMKRILKVIKLDVREIHAFSDSTIALTWITEDPGRWKTFVANRVAAIQERLPQAYWHHIKGKQNPADLATRGISAKELQESKLWWNGPSWLEETILREHTIEPTNLDIPEKKKAFPTVVHVTQADDWMEQFSSWTRLIRTVAYILRFAKICQQKKVNREALSVDEIRTARGRCIKAIQTTEFATEYQQLKQGKPIQKGKLSGLTPFIDEDGIMRMGGRLANSEDLTTNQKHPILLPRKHHVTAIILRELHLQHQHAGPQLLQALFRQEYWAISSRSLVKRIVRNCVKCVRARGETAHQLMGNFPKNRITLTRAFLNCGVDYAGPFTLKSMIGRRRQTYKAYVAIFVCLATKALHLEVVSDLTTQAFIASLRRFVARRGKPQEILSDNGTNFVGANRELQQLARPTKEKTEEITNFLSQQGIKWSFSPPYAPHFGGLWEAGVKSFKYHLTRTIGVQATTFEEFTTILTQIEASLNSRPLCPLTEDPSDLEALTPGHFLIGQPLTAVPDQDMTDTPANRLKRWQLIQQIQQHFWKRWSREYLHTLQQRTKWRTQKDTIKVGDLVIIKESNLPPLCWMLGRVEEIHPGLDQLTRVITLKTRRGNIKRTITNVCRLPTDEFQN